MSLIISVDISGALKKLDNLAKDQIPFATALALTRTAQQIKKDLQSEMRAVFQNPRRFTINSLAIEPAKKNNLTARVYVRSKSVSAALRVEIFGGPRDRAIEKVLGSILPSGMFAVPGPEAKRGSDGKVSIAWLKQLVGKLGITGNVSARAPRRRRSASSLSYFVLTERNGRLPAGIYARSGRQAMPLVFFTTRPNYGAKYDFYGIAERSAREHFADEFKKAAATAMRTAR